MSNWYRIRNFFTQAWYSSDGTDGHSIEYVNTCSWDFITVIRVHYVKHETTHQFVSMLVEIKCEPNSSGKLVEVLRHHLARNSLRKSITVSVDQHNLAGVDFNNVTELMVSEDFDGIVYLTIPSVAAFKELATMLPEINSEFKVVFSDDILRELNNIADFCIELDSGLLRNSYSHEISYQYIEEYVIPDDYSWSILALTGFPNSGYISDEKLSWLQMGLAQGDDPHKVEGGEDCMLSAVLNYPNDLRVMELLLFYRGNPFRRRVSANHPYSVFDHAVKAMNIGLLNLIMDSICIERPFSTKVKRVNTQFANGGIHTALDLYDSEDADEKIIDTLEIELYKEVKEEESIIEISKKSFAMPNDSNKNTITAAITDDMRANNRWVEVIRSKKAVIGFSIYELVSCEDGKDYWYCSLSLIIKHRKSGIMSYMNFRYAHALQLLYPEKVIGLTFLAVSHHSYRIVENIQHWPMYQPSHIRDDMRMILGKLGLPASSEYTHDILVCHVDNQLLFSESKSEKPSLIERHFYRNILNEAGFFANGKAAPVVFFISDQSFEFMQQQCDKMGINFSVSLQTLVMALHLFLDNKKKPFSSTTNSIKDGRLLFWHNMAKPSSKMSDYEFRHVTAKL